jgi:hypothetical protein
MATAILMNTKPHAARHDLESIFYVLIYVATTYKGPENIRKQKDYAVWSSIPVREWFEMQHSFRKMARLRMSHLCDFKGAILHKMDGYFWPLFPFLTNLLNTFFPEHPSTDNDYDNRMTSSTMIDLFNDEYNKLKELESVQMTEKGKRRHLGWAQESCCIVDCNVIQVRVFLLGLLSILKQPQVCLLLYLPSDLKYFCSHFCIIVGSLFTLYPFLITRTLKIILVLVSRRPPTFVTADTAARRFIGGTHGTGIWLGNFIFV